MRRFATPIMFPGVDVTVGIDEESQIDGFANATLQGNGRLAYSIATFVELPPEFTDEYEAGEWLARRLSELTQCEQGPREISFRVEIGLAES